MKFIELNGENDIDKIYVNPLHVIGFLRKSGPNSTTLIFMTDEGSPFISSDDIKTVRDSLENIK